MALKSEFNKFLLKPILRIPHKKSFQPKHKIPLLLDYSVPAPNSWWEHWPSLSWEEGKQVKSNINPVRLVTWARRTDHPDMGTVLDIARDLRHGCDLGTR